MQPQRPKAPQLYEINFGRTRFEAGISPSANGVTAWVLRLDEHGKRHPLLTPGGSLISTYGCTDDALAGITAWLKALLGEETEPRVTPVKRQGKLTPLRH
jgi:hypothetical protein